MNKKKIYEIIFNIKKNLAKRKNKQTKGEKQMKKLVLIVAAMLLLLAIPAFAVLDENNTNQNQGQLQGQGQGQMQGQAAIAAQAQGQLGVVGQEAENDQNTSIGGDENKTYANAWPGLSGGEGISQANAYSIFGGLGLSSTEKYKVYITQIQAIEASASLNDSEKQSMTSQLFAKMMDTNKKQRFLGLFWETSGRNALNLFGILSWDSFWSEGQHPFTKSK